MAKWKNIPDFSDYEISDEGEVRNSKTNLILKPSYTRGGYQKVNLYKDGSRKSVKIHRLVAENFIKKDRDKPHVNHIDGDKTNNRISNLEWCTPSENNKHSYDNGLSYRPITSGVPRRKTRIVETGETFDSVSECARFLGAHEPHVSACLSGKRRTCKGRHVEYVD